VTLPTSAEYQSWNLVVLTQRYLRIALQLAFDGGVLLHCIRLRCSVRESVSCECAFGVAVDGIGRL
jgi:hypothetical protein